MSINSRFFELDLTSKFCQRLQNHKNPQTSSTPFSTSRSHLSLPHNSPVPPAPPNYTDRSINSTKPSSNDSHHPPSRAILITTRKTIRYRYHKGIQTLVALLAHLSSYATERARTDALNLETGSEAVKTLALLARLQCVGASGYVTSSATIGRDNDGP
jgi:hypothetical protein